MTGIKTSFEKKQLAFLREKILDNTRTIISALKDRQNLLTEMAAIKRGGNIPIRDRERELEVMKYFSSEDPWVYPVLNVIFEFSNLVQKNSALNLPWSTLNIEGSEFLRLEGDTNIISFISGIVLGRFGKLIYSEKDLPHNLELGFAFTGSHIINSKLPSSGSLLKIGSKLSKDCTTLNLTASSGILMIPKTEVQKLANSDLGVLS